MAFAEKAGFFKEAGLVVEPFYTDGGAATLTTVLSGSADVGLSNGLLGVIGAYVKGAPVRIISAQMTGEATDYDPRTGAAAAVSRPRDPNVEGPGGYFYGVPDAPGVMTFRAPASGTYRFSFSPCAMWGAHGVVRIGAR